ncbi:ATP-dependent DNA ligase [Lunatimonas salinarum]|uniref:ATP-dependent DNA ligase n=1 Tax=Lunatimonas salinarum TaxID=1774590 RepID=UPI001ADECE49|nr:ATP-dependent DNA ligase [Lunatimonas salinarum]
MKQFSDLFSRLDQSNKTKDKLEYLKNFFLEAPDSDKIWTLALFAHRRPKRTVTASQLREWCQEVAQIPVWLFDECYHTVGDLAETIALLLPPASQQSSKSLTEWVRMLKSLADIPEQERKPLIIQAWFQLSKEERFVFTKLITGGFRVGVSQNMVTQAIADAYQIEKSEVAHRIMGNWDPAQTSFEALILSRNPADDLSRPYPFCLAHGVDFEVKDLGEASEWLVEWKWDGIRGQLIRRKGQTYLWSRGEELITEKFPELVFMAESLPNGTVLDGELLPYGPSGPLPFAVLQTRLGRKTVSKKLMESAPIVFVAYDILESQGKDLRAGSLVSRRSILQALVASIKHPCLLFSAEIADGSWNSLSELREQSRKRKAEGLMLKRKSSPYEAGRKRGNWWKWKIDPLTVDGVLLYAQKGHGRRADLYSDYTLAVWDGELLIPFAKAYSGLTDAEMAEVDRFVKQHTKERFGPVRTVTPELVFEIAFEGIQESARHKSGIALRFPRILRWRQDKKPKDANTLSDLKVLLEQYGK